MAMFPAVITLTFRSLLRDDRSISPSELDAQSTTVRIQGPKDPVPTTRPELFSIAEPHCPAFLCWALQSLHMQP
jgi:hypothetical protein